MLVYIPSFNTRIRYCAPTNRSACNIEEHITTFDLCS